MRQKILALLSILSFTSIGAFANDLDFVSIHGYGAVGGAYQDNKDVLYRNLFSEDKGSQGDFSLVNYTTFGLQLDAQATDDITLTAQATANEHNKDGKLVELVWLNGKYQINDEFSVRVGKMRIPAFMYSDILDVAYSYDWIHLPNMYGILPMYNYNGIELNHNIDFEDFSVASTLLYGTSKSKSIYKYDISDVKLDDLYGAVINVNSDNFTFRLAYSKFDLTAKTKSVDVALSQLNALQIPTISQNIEKYKIDKSPSSYMEVGLKYDYDNIYFLSEYIKLDYNSFLANEESWYISSGYNFEKWSPFILYSKTKSSSNYKPMTVTANTPAQVAYATSMANDAFEEIVNDTRIEIETKSIGLRYNLSDDMVVKLQYDRQAEQRNQSLNFHFTNSDIIDLDIYSVAINFVF